MKIENFYIEGFYLIKPKIYNDNRGYFFESYNKERYEDLINSESFVQDDHSFSNKNVLRGIHFQTHNPQAQLLYLVTGKIFFSLVDFRPNSKTFLNHTSFVMDSKNHYQIYMSPGLGCAFYTLSENVNIIYKISKLYGQSKEIGVRWDDPDLNIDWPEKAPIISEKDKNNSYLKDLKFEKYNDLMRLN